MVTALEPANRRVSIWAVIAVLLPGATSSCTAAALVQPHETRTPAMWTVCLVWLVRSKVWLRVGPRGTEPKSLDNSSNMESAQDAAEAVPHVLRARTTTRL